MDKHVTRAAQLGRPPHVTSPVRSPAVAAV